MQTNVYTTAGAILRKLSATGQDPIAVSDMQQRLSKGQLSRLEDALSLLVSQGEVELLPGRKQGSRRIRLLRPVAPEPHCPTCTCNDVL